DWIRRPAKNGASSATADVSADDIQPPELSYDPSSPLDSSGRTASRGVYKALKQRRELSGPPEILRAPLHADTEQRLRLLNRLDDAVRSGGGDDEPRCGVFHGLMMPAVYGDVTVRWHAASQQHGQARGRRHGHVVRQRVFRHRDRVLDGRRMLARN